MTSFKSLNLNPKILTALENKGYTTPTPIQLQAIPHLLDKKDILGIAQTGTGKTAAFSLPILHNLFASNISVKSGNVRSLILTPTRELASQIAENIEAYGKDLNLRYAVIYGGVSDKPQINELQRGVDILIATPGRLMDLMNQGYIRLMQLEILVLDEADRMLDMGFINDIKKITARIPENRQTLFFSATMPAAITELANSILKNPIRIEITPQSTTVDRIEQKVNFVENIDKPKLLRSILRQKDATSVLVFSITKHGADRIEESLERAGISVAAIHGDKNQAAREKALLNFRDGNIQVLVATDIAARGIDIPAISHVINYDIPSDPESYVHRIGRTARAGRQGVAISFCNPIDVKLLQAVEKVINFTIPVDDSHKSQSKQSRNTHTDNNERDISAPRRSKPLPTSQRNQKQGKENSENTTRRTDNKKPTTRNHNKAASKKKSGILSFIFNIFKGKDTVEKEKNNSRKRSEVSNSKPHNSNKERVKPRARNNNTATIRPRSSGENKPRISGATRKISSGKALPKETPSSDK
jgi:ATP-dependent RNA helicase RhlE